MATDVVMPQMGESIAEGTITKWLVQVGETVERDQPLFEISTDKVDAEIPSPEAGVLLEIKHEEGETVAVDEVVAVIGEEGEEPAEAEEKAAPEPEKAEPEAAEPEEEEEAEAAEAEEEAEEEPAEEEEEPEAEQEEEAPAEKPAEEEAEEEEERAAKAEAAAGEDEDEDAALKERLRTHSSPVVRKMAEEHGVDITELEGTGIHGRVTKADLERYLAEREEEPAEEKRPEKVEKPAAVEEKEPAKAEKPKAAKPEAEKPKAEEPAPEGVSGVPARAASAPAKREPEEFHVPAYREGENVEIEPMSRIRQITAAHMAYSKATSAHVTTCFHMDLSRVHKIRERAKRGFAEAQGTKLTYMPFIFRAVANALKTNKKVNASIDGTDIVYKKDINLGMAVALDWGLLVPVIRNADQLSLVGLAKRANDLAERARSKKLSPDEVQGGTFTITNPGVFGSLWGTPVINQPQVGILGIGVIEKRPIVETDAEGNDTISIKTMSYFSITYDHRLVDGADADAFMNDVKHTLVNETWNELDPYM